RRGDTVAMPPTQRQTAAGATRGIGSRPGAQITRVGAPGVHRPRTLLGERLNDLVRGTLGEVDVVGFCLPADQKIGPGDRFIAEDLAELRRGRLGPKVIAIASSADLVGRNAVAAALITREPR